MKINNECSFPVIAFGWHRIHGYGQAEIVEKGIYKEITGPFIGVMGGGRCNLALPGEITCHEGPDDDFRFQVLDGRQLNLSIDETTGITIRHYLNDLELGN